MIAVPTPFGEEHTPDLSYIEAAAKFIAPVLQKGDLIVLESTSPVGTTEKLSAWLARARPDLAFPHEKKVQPDIHVAYCPERVLPGYVLQELVNNDRIIGGLTAVCAERAIALYKNFVKGECLLTTPRTAELCKLTENAYRDVNIAFANEMSLVSDKLGVNVWELISLANRHPRVSILQPGPGVGGHCIAVDPWFIVDSAPGLSPLIRTAREVNDGKPGKVLEKVLCRADRFKSPCIACFGLTFKADIDDLRESPALDISLQLALISDAKLLLVEPNIAELPAVFDNNPEVELVSIEEAN